jgi:hypothetical protein
MTMNETMFYRLGSEIAYQGVTLDTIICADDEPCPVGWYPIAALFDADGKFVEPVEGEPAKPRKAEKASD